jgi:ascorbate-specific PTS system EIIC-type component UlaA
MPDLRAQRSEKEMNNNNPLPYKIITTIFGIMILIVGYLGNYTSTSPIMVGGGVMFVLGCILLSPYIYYVVINKRPN